MACVRRIFPDARIRPEPDRNHLAIETGNMAFRIDRAGQVKAGPDVIPDSAWPAMRRLQGLVTSGEPEPGEDKATSRLDRSAAREQPRDCPTGDTPDDPMPAKGWGTSG